MSVPVVTFFYILPTAPSRLFMDVRIWGVVENRLIEVCVSRKADQGGLQIEGLPEDRTRTTADRIRAAVVNSGIAAEVPAVAVRLEPPLSGGRTSNLDLVIALGILARRDLLGARLRWIVADGRLGLDGTIYAEDVTEPLMLREVVQSFACQTPLVESEHMFAEVGIDE